MSTHVFCFFLLLPFIGLEFLAIILSWLVGRRAGTLFVFRFLFDKWHGEWHWLAGLGSDIRDTRKANYIMFVSSFLIE